MPQAAETLDARGLHVLPGAIDDHVHFRDPGYPHKEDFASGTAAAALAAASPRVRHAKHNSPTGTPEILADKLKDGRERRTSILAFTPCSAKTPSSMCRNSPRAPSASSSIWATPSARIAVAVDGRHARGVRDGGRTGKRVSLHAETNSIMERRETRMRDAGRLDPLAHLAARPAVVAVEAVSRAAILAEWTGARIHILHISSAEELRPLREAKARGVDITGETCPQYLLLSTDDYARLGGIIRVNPPVREARNQAPLWAALADGTIDIIATDHAPHARAEKTRNDIWTVDCGFPGVETQMPLMLTEVNAGRMSISDYVRWSAANPAKIWGLYPRKGVVQAGAQADLALVDLGRESVIDDALLQSRSKVDALARTAGARPADPYAGARPFRHAGARAGAGDARLGPLGPRLAASAGRRAAQCRADHGRDRPRRRPPRNRKGRHDARAHSRTADASRRLCRAASGDARLWPRRQAGEGARRDRSAHRAGRLHRAGRTVRLRQIHHPQARDRADQRLERRCAGGRPRGGSRAGPRRDGVPESDAAALAHAARQRDAAVEDRGAVPAGVPRQAQGRVPRPDRCAARAGRASRVSPTNIPGSSRVE